MKDKLFEYEIIDTGNPTQTDLLQSFNALFGNNLNDYRKAVIVKCNDCKGKLVIPSKIDERTIIFGISPNAFVLSEKTESIEIPPTVRQIAGNAFNTDSLTAGYCPIVRINYEYGKQGVADSLKINGWKCIYSNWGYSDFIAEKCLIYYEKDELSFKYRYINSSEIEIVKWISPEENIIIPRRIENDLTIVSIGRSAFSGNPHLTHVVVPETIRSIEENAFHYLNHAKYIYGDLYDPGWSNSGDYPVDCLIELPPVLLSIKGGAFLRGTENTDRRHRRDNFTNRLVIVVPKNSATFDLLKELGWIVEIETNEHFILFLDQDCSGLQGWLFKDLLIEHKVVTNRIMRTTYENYMP